ncbi:MAG: hypothetical protein QM757_39520 [Paludibaculum sp.]
MDAVFVVDTTVMQIRQYNDKAAEFFEVATLSIKRIPCTAFNLYSAKTQQPHHRPWHPSCPGSVQWQGDCSFNRENQRMFHGFVSMVSFEYSEQPYLKISILDITSLKIAEFETLQAKEKRKAAGSKSPVHEQYETRTRTPLNAIIGTTHLLMQDHELLQGT